ncbi:MAG: cysteine desulfurase family protein [Catalinimonas sp.]
MRAYLDNAATTPLDPAVFDAMVPYLRDHWGNPSSIHGWGRQVRAAVERSRKQVAELLGAAPAEIFFTSGGTEADNTALLGAVRTLGIRHVLTSAIEHHAVLHTLEHLAGQGEIALTYATLDARGHVDLDALEAWLAAHPGGLVSLMHGNNEVGNLLDLRAVGERCRAHGACFHSDTVQTIGHFSFNLDQTPVDFVVGSAHKFHGPKGVGFLYVDAGRKISPLLHGGAQERNLRGGTENVAGIVGLAKALELAVAEQAAHRAHVEHLKERMAEGLRARIDDVRFCGDCLNPDRSLYTVLNVSLPPCEMADMFLFNLDIAGVAASGGSACSSGSNVGSHVLRALGCDPERSTVRFSFSKFNTPEEIDWTVAQVAALYDPVGGARLVS